MDRLKVALISSVFLSTFSVGTFAEEGSQKSLTIYSTTTPGSISPDLYRPTPNSVNTGFGSNYSIPGYAIVRDERDITLTTGHNKISFSDVAAYIDPTTVVFKSLTDPTGTTVVEQDYHFDLVNNDKLLERYLDQEITVEQTYGNQIESISGKLLSATGVLILQDKNGKVISVNNYSNIRFPNLPGGLITQPTLVWDIVANKAGVHKTRTSYQTQGITWWADYNAVYEEENNSSTGTLNLTAWVSIVNKSGASYENATLKLIAGDINRVQNPMNIMGARMGLAKAEAGTMPQFTEKPFFEFHLYSLGRKTTIADNSTKQIELFDKVNKIPVEKQYIYNGAPSMRYYGNLNTDRNVENPSNTKVEIVLKFKNTEKDGLGIPLPSGRVRVNKIESTNDSLEFIGEDVIDHTPKNESITLKMGNAFDIVGDRKQINFIIDNNRRLMEETIEITLKNHKNQTVTIMVEENLYRGVNWQVLENTHSYEKMDAQTIHFPITLKADTEGKIRYTAHYTW